MTPYEMWHDLSRKRIPKCAALEPEELCEVLHYFPTARMVVLYQARYVLSDFILCAVMDEMVYEGRRAYWLVSLDWNEGKWIYADEIAGVYWTAGGAS